MFLIFFVGGLHEQFSTSPCRCVLDYMHEFKDEEKLIFYNYTVMFIHVYKGLQYLHSKGIVHGDVKGSISMLWCIMMVRTDTTCSVIRWLQPLII